MKHLRVLFFILVVESVANAEPTRVSIASLGSPVPFTSFVLEHRLGERGASATSFWPWGIEGTARIHGPHGFAVGALFAMSGLSDPWVSGPPVVFFDAAYAPTWISSPRLIGLTGSVGLRIGPSVAIVQRTFYPDEERVPPGKVDVPTHAVVGSRVSLVLDLHIWNGVAGIELGYRGGVPVGVPFTTWEGGFVFLLRNGVAFTVGR